MANSFSKRINTWVLIQPSVLSFIIPFLVHLCELDLGNLGWSWHGPSSPCLSLSFAVVGFMSQVWGRFIQVIFAETNKEKKNHKTERKKRKQAASRHFTSINQPGDPLCRPRCILGEKQSELGSFYAAKQRYPILFFFFLHRISRFRMIQTLNMCNIVIS